MNNSESQVNANNPRPEEPNPLANNPKKSSKTLIISIIAICTVIVLGVFCALVYIIAKDLGKGVDKVLNNQPITISDDEIKSLAKMDANSLIADSSQLLHRISSASVVNTGDFKQKVRTFFPDKTCKLTDVTTSTKRGGLDNGPNKVFANGKIACDSDGQPAPTSINLTYNGDYKKPEGFYLWGVSLESTSQSVSTYLQDHPEDFKTFVKTAPSSNKRVSTPFKNYTEYLTTRDKIGTNCKFDPAKLEFKFDKNSDNKDDFFMVSVQATCDAYTVS